jgi:hypothetical protein
MLYDNEVTQAGDNAKLPYLTSHWKSSYEAKFTSEDEARIRQNFDISSSVQLHFKDPKHGTFDGGEICLFERMFLGGLRLPFPAIARELLQYLHIAPSQIRPNGWRYFFALFMQWPTILRGHLMSIHEFFYHIPGAGVQGWDHCLSSSRQPTLHHFTFHSF